MFQIIKYIQPTWYFNLKPTIDRGYFPYSEFATDHKSTQANIQAFTDAGFTNFTAYTAHKSGLENIDSNKKFDWWNTSGLSVKDEYLFARTNYRYSRVILACFIRMLFLHNPVKEIYGLLSTSGVSKKDVSSNHDLPESYKQFQSKLVSDQPMVTVIIPTLNRYQYLNDVLSDLELQDYPHFDVIVVDQSDPFDDRIYENRKLTLKVIKQKEKALWLARNTAIQHSNSEFLLFYDDDSRVSSDWITQHLKCIDFFQADISSGVSLSDSDKSIPKDYKYFKWSDQLDTGNVMIKREIFRKSGLFDRQFEKQRMGDGEFGLRTYLDGFKNVSNPLASRIHLKVGAGGLREMGNWDAYRPKSFWSPRPIPSVLYFFRKYFGTKATIISLIINTPPSVVPYKFKRNKIVLIAGSMFALLLSPLIIIQIMRSWIIATKMLNNPKIVNLN